MASAAAELVAEREIEPRIEMTDSNRTFVGAQGLVRMALDQYTEILTTVSDPRVSDWPLMDSPVPTVLIVLLYLYIVVIFGPRMMANRKPYKLRGVLLVYNAFQVVFSLGMLYEVRIPQLVDHHYVRIIKHLIKTILFLKDRNIVDFSLLKGLNLKETHQRDWKKYTIK